MIRRSNDLGGIDSGNQTEVHHGYFVVEAYLYCIEESPERAFHARMSLLA